MDYIGFPYCFQEIRRKEGDILLNYERYAQFRDAKGLTDYKVSCETGISTSTISEWGKGLYTPKADKIVKICRLLDIPIEEAFDE